MSANIFVCNSSYFETAIWKGVVWVGALPCQVNIRRKAINIPLFIEFKGLLEYAKKSTCLVYSTVYKSGCSDVGWFSGRLFGLRSQGCE